MPHDPLQVRAALLHVGKVGEAHRAGQALTLQTRMVTGDLRTAVEEQADQPFFAGLKLNRLPL